MRINKEELTIDTFDSAHAEENFFHQRRHAAKKSKPDV